jgi:hypothetical protein
MAVIGAERLPEMAGRRERGVDSMTTSTKRMGWALRRQPRDGAVDVTAKRLAHQVQHAESA